MRLQLLSAGRTKTCPERALAAEYLSRALKLGRTAGLTEIGEHEVPESDKDQEAQALLGKLRPGAYAIALDEHGQMLDSPGFCALLRARMDQGVPAIAFVIGGPDGHGAAVLARADFRLSLGPMTWPHRLCRTLIAEQIYRAVTIMVNHPYHRS